MTRLALLAVAALTLFSCHWELNRAGGLATANTPSGPDTAQGSVIQAASPQEKTSQPLEQAEEPAHSGGSCHRN